MKEEKWCILRFRAGVGGDLFEDLTVRFISHQSVLANQLSNVQ